MRKFPLKKYSPPTNIVSEPKGTIWAVEGENHSESFYIQLSDDPKAPHWERFGEMLEAIFKPYCTDDGFMDELFKVYTKELENGASLLGFIQNKKN